ncbi:hypothetical protein CGLAMM_07155 [Acetobacteraceae bacterium EV16G]|uniref:Uncharacterized protein n=1 Tax=Sorlinia euscelidii TaxID=3081148 RepID=A0ABU7U584_9PROT
MKSMTIFWSFHARAASDAAVTASWFHNKLLMKVICLRCNGKGCLCNGFDCG